MIRSVVVVAVVLGSIACATTQNAAPVAGAQSPTSQLTSAALSSLATRVNVKPEYVELAATTAQSLLGQGKTPADASAKGVEQAGLRASSEGNAFTQLQSSGLTSGLTDLLGGG